MRAQCSPNKRNPSLTHPLLPIRYPGIKGLDFSFLWVFRRDDGGGRAKYAPAEIASAAESEEGSCLFRSGLREVDEDDDAKGVEFIATVSPDIPRLEDGSAGELYSEHPVQGERTVATWFQQVSVIGPLGGRGCNECCLFAPANVPDLR